MDKPRQLCPLILKSHPLIGATLRIFHSVAQKYHLASSPGPLTPLAQNPEFSMGLAASVLPSRGDKTPVVNYHCIEQGKLKSFEQLQAEMTTK